MIRKFYDGEAVALLKGVQCGILDLTSMPGYEPGGPLVYYGECIKDEAGVRWVVNPLAIVRKDDWDAICRRFKREPVVKIGQDLASRILLAVLAGEINEALFSEVYPLNPKPILQDVIYTGFSKDEFYWNKSCPDVPKEWDEEFATMAQDGYGLPPLRFEHFNDRHFLEHHGKEPDCFDYSTGESISRERAFLCDRICTGFF